MASSVDEKALKTTKFPPEFNKKVDTEKVNMPIMLTWLSSRLPEYMGTEDDDIMVMTVNNMLATRWPEIKKLQIFLRPTLNGKEEAFCKELWDLMLSAQESDQGVPPKLLEAKKLQLKQDKASKAAAESRRREQQAQNEMIDTFRQAEQSERADRHQRGGRPRGGYRGDGGRYRGGRGADFGRDNQRSRRDSRSPSPRPRSPPPRREADTYVPGRSSYRDRSRGRRRSPSYGGRSGSPPRRRTRRTSSSTPERSRSVRRSRSPAPRRSRRSPSHSRSSRSRRHDKYSGRARDRSYERGGRSRRQYSSSLTPDRKTSSPSPRRDQSASPAPRGLRREESERSLTMSVTPKDKRKSGGRLHSPSDVSGDVSDGSRADIEKGTRKRHRNSSDDAALSVTSVKRK